MTVAKPIWLVGMMGAGKSTIGPKLAERLGRAFVDTDREIEAAQGCAVAEIFARDGEAAFRKLEAEAIAAVPAASVAALGGGAIAQPGMPERLALRGTVIYLKASISTILRRVGKGDSRPLVAGLATAERRAVLERLLAERRGAYESASITVNVAKLDVRRVVAAIEQQIEQLPAEMARDLEEER